MLFLYLMPADSDEIKIETATETLVCEACGESFFCGSKIGKCWCFEIEVGEAALEKLKTNYQNCLCEKCLAEFQSKAE